MGRKHLKHRLRLGRRARVRDTAIAAVLALIAIGFFLAASVGGNGSPPRLQRTGGGLLPHGWHEVRRPITGVLYPVQVLAAATYPIAPHGRPRSCGPWAAVNQMPPGGALVQIVEYAPTDGQGKKVRVPSLPPRPPRFSYADATYAPFECAGLSFKFDYRQEGHALQAQVWMHRHTVGPRTRAAALQILNRFRPGKVEK